MKTVLVIGATGMLGRALVLEGQRRGAVVRMAARNGAELRVDLASEDSLAAALAAVQPTTVINCAAITSIDICSQDQAAGWRVNARGVALLADLCRSAGAGLVQISTDHYYSGDGTRRHAEGDPVVLVNDYARTKYAGEAFALTHPSALVVRTNIVGFRGWEQKTLVEWAIETLAAGRPMVLFDDFFVSSLDVHACARAIFDLVDKAATGICNVASHDVFSKADFISALAGRLGLSLDRTERGSVDRMQVRRADSLGLDVSHAEAMLGYRLASLDEVVGALAREYEGKCAGIR